MFKKNFNLIFDEFLANNAKGIVSEIARYHRIQSSPGFRAAVKYSQEILKQFSIPYIQTHRYPARGNNFYWSCPVPKEWNITDATLDLIEPKEFTTNLCRFLDKPCSLIQRSKATPPSGIEGEVIEIPSGINEDDMKTYDVLGKFILTDEPNLSKIKLLANKFGALGIIYDLVTEFPPIRTRNNFPTARRYTSFWYGKEGLEGNTLGFVLSAQQGNNLRNLLHKIEGENKILEKEGKEKKKMKLKAKIDAQFYNGEMEVLDFVIPGKEAQQEIVAVAHLCHPKPSAVDNASGCGTLIEVARTLQNLITEKKLTQPQRGIRFLLVAEYTGSFCYLASNEDKINKMVAGINLDMIGADQSMGGGRTLLLEHTPNSNPSFVNDVLSAIFTEVCTKNENIETNGQIVSLKYNEQAFTGGSDHAVFNDIDVQVGMPMLMQWPDRYYHTSEDTIEKVSAEMLHIVGAITATYCYFLANANFTDILWIASEVVSKGKERIGMCGRKMFNEHINLLEEIKATKNTRKGYQEFFFKMKEKIETKINFQKDVEIKVLSSIQKLLQMENEKVTLIELLDEYQKDLERYTESEIARVKVSIEKIAFSMNIPLSQKKVEKLIIKEKIIPKKVFKGNLTNLSFLDMPLDDVIELESINKECKDAYVIFENALNWIDGIKSLEEISHLVELDVGKTNLPFLTKIFEFHQKQGALKLIKKKEKE